MSKQRSNVLIGQSGGPTAVINQTLVGLIETALDSGKVGRVLGTVHGIRGLLEGRLVDLGRESRAHLEKVANTPCAALRSVRKKPTAEECAAVLDALVKNDVRYFFYIGGNDSAETAHLLNELAVAKGYELALFHCPKTIDNDLRQNDHCPGYGSAARFVAQAFQGDEMDNRSLAGVKIDVVMGRHAGWLTAASALARDHADAGPHLIYLPERDFDLDRFAADVERVYAKLGRCLVAVSEGIHGPGGKLLFEVKERDSHGNAQLSGSGALGDFLAAEVKQRLGAKLRVRADTFGYLQRSFPGAVSPVDALEAREVGRRAMAEALSGRRAHGSLALQRAPGPVYAPHYEVVELKSVAKETRHMGPEHLAGDEGVTEAFLDYVRPLVGPLVPMARLSDFPV